MRNRHGRGKRTNERKKERQKQRERERERERRVGLQLLPFILPFKRGTRGYRVGGLIIESGWIGGWKSFWKRKLLVRVTSNRFLVNSPRVTDGAKQMVGGGGGGEGGRNGTKRRFAESSRKGLAVLPWTIDGAKQDSRRNHFYALRPVITSH